MHLKTPKPKIIGLRPITDKMIEEETKRVTKINQTEPNRMTRNQLQTAATKNLIAKFLRNHKKMDNDVRDDIKILEIFPSSTDDSDIMYMRCETTDDINKISSRVEIWDKKRVPMPPQL